MKKRKLFMLLIISLILAVTIAGCSSSSTNNVQNGEGNNSTGSESETITFKVATYFANTSQLYRFVTEPWMKRVTELTNGKVQFDLYPAEQLGKAQDMLNLTRDKVTDIAVFPANYFPDNMPLSNMLAGLPNLSETADQGTKAYYDLVQENTDVLETDFLKNGIRPIGVHVSPTYEVWSTKKIIRVPEDLKGLKIRTPGGVANEVYEKLGVVPVTVTHSETYEALEKGVIDALSSSSIATDSNGTIELLKHVVMPHIGTALNTIVINENVWKGLPEDVQQAMEEASREIIIKTGGAAYDEDTLRINEEFLQAGGTITELTEDEINEWKQITDKFTQDWLKENKADGLPYEEVINHYKDLLEKHK